MIPLHLGHHTARLVMTQKLLSEKSLQKKKGFPSLIHKAPPSFSEIKQFTYSNFEAYLNILFAVIQRKNTFPTLKKKHLLIHN